jgi:hypothetical protein
MRDYQVRNPYNLQHLLNEYRRHEYVYSETKMKRDISFSILPFVVFVVTLVQFREASNSHVRRPSCRGRKVNPSSSPFSRSSPPHPLTTTRSTRLPTLHTLTTLAPHFTYKPRRPLASSSLLIHLLSIQLRLNHASAQLLSQRHLVYPFAQRKGTNELSLSSSS